MICILLKPSRSTHHARDPRRCPPTHGGGGMLGQPFRMPITKVAPSVSGVAGYSISGMGAYLVPYGIPYPAQSSDLTVGPGGGG